MSEAPVGSSESRAGSSTSTVLAFLIADIRGYTKYTSENGVAAGARLADAFARICNAVVDNHSGQVLGLAGDEALAAFVSPRDAVEAAIELQRRLRAQLEADQTLQLLAGIGLDIGEVVPIQGGYRGQAINLAARLCSLAGRGEILSSEAIPQQAMRIAGLAYVERGHVPLKGIDEDVRVIQILPESELPDNFPPLLSPVNKPNNLPVQTTPFIGRVDECQTLTELLTRDSIRLVSLTGPGGIGKTRLAVHAGERVLDHFERGVFFHPLANLSDADLVPSAIASAFKLKESPGQTPLRTLITYLRDKHILLILDNFEQIVSGADLVAQLVYECPRLTLLVTTRAILQLSAEHEFNLAPLALPDQRHSPSLEKLESYDAVALLLDRARAAKSGFQLTAQNAQAVASICRRVDGLPLAIELAASRLRLFPPEALLQRLTNRLRLLTGGATDRPSRQQTLRATIDWSHSLLSPNDQILFARLGVFSGPWTFEAAESVCLIDGDLDLLDGVTALVNQSLIRLLGGEEPRFAMLEVIREYAAELLGESQDADAIRRQYADFFLQLVEDAEPRLYGPEQDIYLNRLEEEYDDIRAVLEWASSGGSPEVGLRIAAALRWFWFVHGRFSEGRSWLERLLAVGETASPKVRARALISAGMQAWQQGDPAAIDRFCGEGLRLSREAGTTDEIATSLIVLSYAPLLRGDLVLSIELQQEALELARAENDHVLIATSLAVLGYSFVLHGEMERGLAASSEALGLCRESGNRWLIASVLEAVARASLETGGLGTARAAWREGLTLITGKVADFVFQIPYFLDGLAAVAARSHEPARAVRLFAAADSQRVATGAELPRLAQDMRNRDLELAKGQIDESAWRREWDVGQALSPEQAIVEALEETADAPHKPAADRTF